MILTVTLNAAVDKTYTVEDFQIDRVHRPSSWRVVPGGKGINVSRVYKELGGEALATGLIGGHNGDYILDGMDSEGLAHDFVRTAGESRECIAVLDPVQNTQTELNEVGPEVSPKEIAELKAKFEKLVIGKEIAIFSGSIPPGAPDDIYRELIEIAKRYEVKCVLDTSGEPLAQGLKAIPFMTKPNIHEISAIMDSEFDTHEEVVDAACALHAQGIEIVVVTLGRDGAIIVVRDEILSAKPPSIPFVSAVGSGDAFAAAFIYALVGGGSIGEALKFATGAGAANAMSFGAGFCKKDDIYRLAEKTIVTPIEVGVR